MLNLSRKNLRSVPPEVIDRPDLTDIYLDDNFITELPKNRFASNKIKTLDIAGNMLHELPFWICDLHKLNRLNIDDNFKLTKLPEELGKLPNLFLFSAKNTAITKLPESFKKLKKITNISLGGVALSTLYPLTFSNLYFDFDDKPLLKLLPTEFIPTIKACFEKNKAACIATERIYRDSAKEIIKNIIVNQSMTKREYIRLCNEAKHDEFIKKLISRSLFSLPIERELTRCMLNA